MAVARLVPMAAHLCGTSDTHTMTLRAPTRELGRVVVVVVRGVFVAARCGTSG